MTANISNTVCGHPNPSREEFHLFVEFLPDENSPKDPLRDSERSVAEPDRLVVPEGVSILTSEPCLRSYSNQDDHKTKEAVLLEPFGFSSQTPRLLLIQRGRDILRINSQLFSSPAVLKPGDQFQFITRMICHLALYRRPQIGYPDSQSIGKPCPICLTNFTEESTCYACRCGASLHCDLSPDEENLQCARLTSNCPVCAGSISLNPGYLVNPDL